MAKERLGVSGGTGNHNHCSREASGTSRGFTLSLGPFPVVVSGSGLCHFWIGVPHVISGQVTLVTGHIAEASGRLAMRSR